MAGDKTYITDTQGKMHRATRVHAVTPTDIVWSSNPNDYTVQVKIDGKWHRAVLTMDAGSSTFFDNINIDKALVTGTDGKQHTALIVKPESTVTLSDIKTDTHGIIAGTTSGETAMSTYSENWSDVKWQDNVNVYKVLVTGSDSKVHTALLTTSAGGGIEVIVLGTSPLLLPNAIADSLTYVKAFGGTEQGVPAGYTQLEYIEAANATQYIRTNVIPDWTTEIDSVFRTGNNKTFSALSRWTNSPTADTFGTIVSSTSSNMVSYFGRYSDGLFQNDTSLKLNANQNVVYKLGESSIQINEHTYSITRRNSGFENALPLWIFRGNFLGEVSAVDPTGSRVYSLKIKTQGKLVFNGIPAKNSASVIGLYDTVSGQFFTNAGTGTFTAGPAVVPTPDAPIDIVSNNGVLVFRDTELPLGYRRLKDVVFDGEVYYVTNIYPTGADTITYTINAAETGRNVLGSYTGNTSGNNLSFYLATGNSGNYVRYKDSLYRPVLANNKLNTDLTLSIGPTGTTGFDTNKTWTELEFACPNELYVGWLANATSPKFKGSFKGNVTISNRAVLIPCERTTDGAIGYYNINDNIFFENQGTGTPTTSGYDYSHCDIMADGTVETIEDTIGNTATAEMLLKVGDYQDEQDIPAGVVTRKVGVKVLDGTENWASVDQYSRTFIQITDMIAPTSPRVVPAYCNYFENLHNSEPISAVTAGQFYLASPKSVFFHISQATADDFKTWLAQQYAAGTPVIIIYPLATEIAESVPGQTLQVTDGDNTLEITQASLSGLELEAEYTKVA